MKHLLIPSLVSLAAIAAPATGQKTGQSNRAAPVVTQSVELPAAGAKISLTYTAITWAGGQFMKELEKPAKREEHNKLAEAKPLGQLTTTTPLTIGGKSVPAGTHKLAFRVDPITPVTNEASGTPSKSGWRLTLTPESGEPIDCPLELKPSPKETTRLMVAVVPGAKDNEAELCVGFGTLGCTLPVRPAGAGARDAAGEKPMKGDGMGHEGEAKGKDPKKEK